MNDYEDLRACLRLFEPGRDGIPRAFLNFSDEKCSIGYTYVNRKIKDLSFKIRNEERRQKYWCQYDCPSIFDDLRWSMK